jgi:hypothetical protein
VAAVRIQRRRHIWAVVMIWLIVIFLLLAGSVNEASQDGTPAPAWFVQLMLGFAAAAVVALGVVIGYSVAMRRRPAELRAQAILLERQRLSRLGWPRRVRRIFWWTCIWLGIPLFLGAAVLGVAWILDGASRLLGAKPVAGWAATSIHSNGDAAVAVIIGLLLVFGGALSVLFIYRLARRVWLRHLMHLAEAGAINWPPPGQN